MNKLKKFLNERPNVVFWVAVCVALLAIGLCVNACAK